MAKSLIIEIDQLIKQLEMEIAKGETKVTLYGYIADENNNRNIAISDKSAFNEPSFAEWQLDQNGY